MAEQIESTVLTGKGFAKVQFLTIVNDVKIYLEKGYPIKLTRYFPTYTHRVYLRAFRAVFGLWVSLPPHPTRQPHTRFLFVGSVFCHELPSELASRQAPCSSAKGSHRRAPRGLAPPSRAPCRAHNRKAPLGLHRAELYI